jgi:hypothetical protein
VLTLNVHRHYTYSPGLSISLLRIIRIGHRACKYPFGKAFGKAGATKEELGVDEMRARAGLGPVTEEDEKMACDDEDEGEDDE